MIWERLQRQKQSGHIFNLNTKSKKKYLELIPQISLYFHDLDENKGKEFFKNGGLEKLRSELNELVGEDGYNYFW